MPQQQEQECLKEIGRGFFTTAYLRNDNKVLLKSTDYIKECMAMGWFPNSRLFPKVSFSDNRNEYIMKYYPRVKSLKTSLNPKDYEIYKELRAIHLNLPKGYDSLHKVFTTISNKRVKEALLGALDACANYGVDVFFEISPRNVSVSKAGRLVLMDCFFMESQLLKIQKDRAVEKKIKELNNVCQYSP